MIDAEGEYIHGWKPTKLENPDFKCRICGSDDVFSRSWESSCGGFDDINYQCHGCGRQWWVESSDA